MRIKLPLEKGGRGDGSRRMPGRERFDRGRTNLIRALAVEK